LEIRIKLDELELLNVVLELLNVVLELLNVVLELLNLVLELLHLVLELLNLVLELLNLVLEFITKGFWICYDINKTCYYIFNINKSKTVNLNPKTFTAMTKI
jgi:hypothetical protein